VLLRQHAEGSCGRGAAVGAYGVVVEIAMTANFYVRGMLANLVTLAILLACLFILAGTLTYWQAWIFLAVFAVSSQALGILVVAVTTLLIVLSVARCIALAFQIRASIRRFRVTSVRAAASCDASW
jgi:hypothetical protein